MYPGDSQGGLLRLQSTFRHDLKMYASDEGRVQLTAAAFAKGLLDLEGDLTPILVSLVNMEKSANKRLNDTDLARSHLTVVKEKLHRALALDVDDAALPSFGLCRMRCRRARCAWCGGSRRCGILGVRWRSCRR